MTIQNITMKLTWESYNNQLHGAQSSKWS